MTSSIATSAWTWPAPVLADRTGSRTAHLRTADNDIIELAVNRWHDEPDAEDLTVLARATGPVLDVGCGPGRHVAALVKGGVAALGIDTSRAAVATTRRRGAPAVKTSIFGPIPNAGSWATILLLDGNIGIGGNEYALLTRAAELLTPTGHVLAEVESPATPAGPLSVRVETAGLAGRWFPWARVTARRLEAVAGTVGYTFDDVWQAGDRWFVELGRTQDVAPAIDIVAG